MRKLNRRVQDALSSIQKQMKDEQKQTREKLRQIEEQQIAMNSMLSHVIKEFENGNPISEI